MSADHPYQGHPYKGHRQEAALEALHAAASWPDLTHVTPWNYTLGGYGRHLVEGLITGLGPQPVILEVGCFLGASARRWLGVRDDLVVVGIDPWDDSLIAQCRRYVGRPGLTRAYPDLASQERFADDVATQGPYATALANIPDPKHRFIPVRGLAPDAFAALVDAGLQPDLIYIDANKDRETLDAAHACWPDALITGDDWHWNRVQGYPMRKIVRAFASDHGFEVQAEHATWILTR